MTSITRSTRYINRQMSFLQKRGLRFPLLKYAKRHQSISMPTLRDHHFFQYPQGGDQYPRGRTITQHHIIDLLQALWSVGIELCRKRVNRLIRKDDRPIDYGQTNNVGGNGHPTLTPNNTGSAKFHYMDLLTTINLSILTAHNIYTSYNTSIFSYFLYHPTQPKTTKTYNKLHSTHKIFINLFYIYQQNILCFTIS